MKGIPTDKKEREFPEGKTPSILVVRFSSMGDILLTTPVLRSLRRRWPGAIISFLTKERFAPLLQGNPHLNEIFFLPEDGSAGDLAALARSLGRRPWDLLLDLHNSLRSRLVRLLVPAREVKVYSKMILKRTLLIYGRLDLFPAPIPTVPERYAGCLSPFGVELDQRGCELFLDEKDKNEFEEQLKVRWPGGSGGKDLLAVAPGSAWPIKRWPAERFALSARELARRFELEVVILGSEGDRELCRTVAESLGVNDCVDLSGRLSIRGSAAAVASSRCLLTNDTGLMHIATAVGTPLAALFGPTTRHLGYFPYRFTAARVIETKLLCRPCTHNGRKRCVMGHFRCMKDIGPETVVEAAEGLLKECLRS